MARLRTRKHKVVLNRSVGGDLGITIMLTLLGIFMFLPMYYVVIQSFKPLDELWMFPPKFIVIKPDERLMGPVLPLHLQHRFRIGRWNPR